MLTHFCYSQIPSFAYFPFFFGWFLLLSVFVVEIMHFDLCGCDCSGFFFFFLNGNEFIKKNGNDFFFKKKNFCFLMDVILQF